MLKKMSDDEHHRGDANIISFSPTAKTETRAKSGPVSWFKDLLRGRVSNSNNLQEVLEDYIEELNEAEGVGEPAAESQKELITNILKTRGLRVSDVMVPRADIVAIEENATEDDLKILFRDDQLSRFPVYKCSLDHVIGVLHIKDLLACLLEGRKCKIADLVREVMIVPPGMPVMDLFITMRDDKKPMALVVDEHGGIDGLVTMNDVIEAIVGEIEDEFDTEEQPQIIEKPDGSIIADARLEIEDFEERYGNFLSPEEREDIETLGGLAFHLAGHVPKRGEILRHASGLVVEILDANASRVSRVRIRNLSANPTHDEV